MARITSPRNSPLRLSGTPGVPFRLLLKMIVNMKEDADPLTQADNPYPTPPPRESSSPGGNPFFAYSKNSKHARPGTAVASENWARRIHAPLAAGPDVGSSNDTAEVEEGKESEVFPLAVFGKGLSAPYARPQTAYKRPGTAAVEGKTDLKRISPPKREPILRYDEGKNKPAETEDALKYRGMKWKIIQPLSRPMVASDRLVKRLTAKPAQEPGEKPAVAAAEDIIADGTKENYGSRENAEYVSETANELRKLTMQFCAETPQVPRPPPQRRTLAAKRPKTAAATAPVPAQQSGRPNVEIMKSRRRDVPAKIGRVGPGKEAEIKQRVNAELTLWMTQTKEKRQREVDKFMQLRNERTAGGRNSEIADALRDDAEPVITNTIKRYSTRFSQAGKILRAVLRGSPSGTKKKE